VDFPKKNCLLQVFVLSLSLSLSLPFSSLSVSIFFFFFFLAFGSIFHIKMLSEHQTDN
jgi:hypothetical protein